MTKAMWIKGMTIQYSGKQESLFTQFLVHVTGDEIGKTLSIANEELGIQYTVPFEPIEEFLINEDDGR